MTTSINKYRLYCNVESIYVYTWSMTEPTMCPNDHINRTNITAVTIVDNISTSNMNVTAQDSSPSAGWYQSSTIIIDVPVGTANSIYTMNFSFPFDMYIWSASLTQPINSEQDTFTYAIAPDTVIGVLTQNATIGATTVYLSATVFNVLTRGCEGSITNGTTTDMYGKITALNMVAGSMTFQTPLTNNYSAGSSVTFTNYPIRDHVMDYNGERINFAVKGLQTKMIPANYGQRIIYKNVNGQAKKVNYQIEYYMV